VAREVGLHVRRVVGPHRVAGPHGR
jgi:hypothetical protein